jgi:hypothetical protein
MERLTVFDGEFWVHKNFPPVGEDTIDEFIDCVKELAARLAAYEDTGLEPDDIKRVFNEDAVLNLAGQALGITPDRLRELAQADREGRCFIGPFVAMIEQSLSGGEMKPQRDQRFNGRYAVVYFDPKKWSSPLIDICGTPYNRGEAEERMKVLKAALRREQDG